MANLYVMMGAPGAGKSTFLKNLAEKIPDKKFNIVSRDAIRFRLVREDEPYFSHEDEVLQELWNTINSSLAEGENVYVDQTSLTINSRKYLLSHAKGYDKAICIWIDNKYSTCLSNNEKRKGTRAYVPPKVIEKMYWEIIPPSLDEGFYSIYRYKNNELFSIQSKDI